jgi:hypothetical protein
MLKLKSHLTCSYCSKIFKHPILLSCNDSICLEHLSERDVVKQNRIKCNKCKQEFQVRDNQFKSNKSLTQLIENQSHLIDEEINLKQQLEISIKVFFEYYDEFIQNKAQLDMGVFEHFQEMRFKVDEQREDLKKRIDDIALELIDKIKKSEEIYLNELKEKISSVNVSQSLETELKEIQETFRNPSLLIETIRDMQFKQEESLKDIQLKLNQINQVKDNLKATHFFKSNLSLLNQNASSLFGSIKLGLYSNMNSFKSEILRDEQQSIELINLCEFSPNDKWTLLYRGTRDGFDSKDFHSKCDNHANTFTIFKAKQSQFIFGGFTSVHWDCSYDFKSDPNAFIFSLTNKDNKPLKMKINPNQDEYAIYCHFELGPTFGCDIRISNHANTTMYGCSNLGNIYIHPQYAYGTNEAKTFLAGSFEFQLDEIEVYEKKLTFETFLKTYKIK